MLSVTPFYTAPLTTRTQTISRTVSSESLARSKYSRIFNQIFRDAGCSRRGAVANVISLR